MQILRPEWEEEIKTGTITAELVYLDQAKHEVGILLNPQGGTYMTFECGGELAVGRGPFLAPVGPINQEATSFTATLSRLGATQTPTEYENENGEKLQAIPTGKTGTNPLDPFVTTGVELSFAVHPSSSLKIRAVSAAEVEAKQREEEAARAAAEKKRQEEEAAKAAAKAQEEEQAKAERLRLARQRAKALKRCRKAGSKHRRMRCEKRAKKKYGPGPGCRDYFSFSRILNPTGRFA
jgi:hypothetical protein